MNSRIFGLHGALAALALAAACKEDPTAAHVGTPNSLAFELNARTVAVADSFRSFVLLRDELGNPLAAPVTVTSCNTGVATVLPASDAPQVRTAFFVKAVAFNATSVCITASAAGFTDTMMVTAVPFALQVTGGPANDTIASGTTGTYTFIYKDALGVTLTGVTSPTFSTGDTTIAKAGATVGQVSGRAPGLTVVTATLKIVPASGDTVRIAGTPKNVTIVPAAFTGTTSSPVVPGAFLIVYRGTAPAFDDNTATSIGANDTTGAFPPQPGNTDSLKVRVSDLASAGTKKFTITGLGAADVADTGSYVVAAPPAFAGTFVPSPAQAGINIKIVRNAADPPFDTLKNRFFRGRPAASDLAAVTWVKNGVWPDSFKLAVSDLATAGTYFVQVTRLGASNAAWRGTYSLPVGTWGGTMTPSSGRPVDKIVLRRGGGDPLFDADTRVYLGGVQAFIDSFSSDTAVVIVPPLEFVGTADLRISRMDAGQLAVDGADAFTSTFSSPLDPLDHANDFTLGASSLTANGTYYGTLSGTCDGGVATKGADDCDDFFKVTNPSGTDTLFAHVDLAWNTGADIDILWCRNAACSSVTSGGGATVANPEHSNVKIPPGATWYLWLNFFDNAGVNSALVQFKVTGFP